MQLQVVTSALQQHASVGALPHVRALISSFLGPSSNLSLRNACELGSIELLDCIWESSPTSETERTPRWTLTNYLRSEPYYYKYQFHEAIQVAARRGDLEMVKWFFEHFSGCEVPSAAVVEAAEGGHLPVLQYLLENDAGRDCSRVEVQVVLDEDKWTDSVPVMPEGWKGPGNVVRWGSHAITAAVIGRHPEVARWLVDSTPRINDEVERSQLVELAVNIGAFEIAELYMAPDANLVDCVDIRLQTAAIETLLERGYLQQSTEASAIAIWTLARDGNLDLMKRVAGLHRHYPRKKESEWVQYWQCAFDSAISRGDIPMLKWMMTHPTVRRICKDLKEGEWESFDGLLHKAAEGGHVEAQAYFVEQGCSDGHGQALTNASRKGHLDCVKWLFERFSPYQETGSAVVEAASAGHLEILQFLHDQELSASAEGEASPKRRRTEPTSAFWSRSLDAFEAAASNGHLEVVKWLHANRFEGSPAKAMDSAARNGHLEVVKWLHKNTTAGCTTRAMDAAASNGHLEVVKWLHANRKEGCTLKAVEHAIPGGHLGVMTYLRKHFPDLVPTHNRLWVHPSGDLFDVLLFLQANYPTLFTPEFGRGTRSEMVGEHYEGSDFLVEAWLEEKYPGEPTEERQVHLWSTL